MAIELKTLDTPKSCNIVTHYKPVNLIDTSVFMKLCCKFNDGLFWIKRNNPSEQDRADFIINVIDPMETEYQRLLNTGAAFMQLDRIFRKYVRSIKQRS